MLRSIDINGCGTVLITEFPRVRRIQAVLFQKYACHMPFVINVETVHIITSHNEFFSVYNTKANPKTRSKKIAETQNKNYVRR